jgi:oligopeptide/dipeptide ABC transporter ATP-binding protein
MYAGRIVERAPTQYLFEHPVHPYTEALLRAVPRTGSTGEPLFTIGGLPPSLARLPTGCSFEPRCQVGRGLEICRSSAPEPEILAPGAADVIAECHFARQRHAALADAATEQR